MSLRDDTSSAGSNSQLLSSEDNPSESEDSRSTSCFVDRQDSLDDEASQDEPAYSELVHGSANRAAGCQPAAAGGYGNLCSETAQYSNPLQSSSYRHTNAGDTECKYSSLKASSAPRPKRPMLLTRDRLAIETCSKDEFRYIEPGEDVL